MFGYVAYHFQKPGPFKPDVVFDVTDVEDRNDADGRAVEHAEAVEISEYGAPLTDDRRDELFF